MAANCCSRTSEVYSGHTGYSILYIIVFLFFSKAGSLLLSGFVPAIRYSPGRKNRGLPLLSGLFCRVFRSLKWHVGEERTLQV